MVDDTYNSNPARRVYEQFTYSPQTYYGGNRTDLPGTATGNVHAQAASAGPCQNSFEVPHQLSPIDWTGPPQTLLQCQGVHG